MVGMASQALGGCTATWLARAGVGKGCFPGSQTVAFDSVPTTYGSPG
jgi:hypothetical protein